jgi:DNA-binding HxlR family transcriptional regulator
MAKKENVFTGQPVAQHGEACKFKMLAIKDTMDILGGKWKIQILGSLGFG